MIEVNASVFKKLKDICENYEKLKEKYEKDKKKRIVGRSGGFSECLEKALSRRAEGASRRPRRDPGADQTGSGEERGGTEGDDAGHDD